MTLALIFSIMIGILSDKWRISNILFIVFGVSVVGILIFTQITEPKCWLTFIAVVFINIGN